MLDPDRYVWRFHWEDDKRLLNLKQHKLDFKDAGPIFVDDLAVTFEDTRFAYEERRYITMGRLRDRVVVVVHTEDEAANELKLISMRYAIPREEKAFYAGYPGG